VDRSPIGGDAADAEGFLANVALLKSVLAPSPLSPPIVEFLIARFGRDDLNPDWQQHDSAELEATTTGLTNDPRMVGGYIAHGVDLIIVLSIGEGCDFGEQSFERASRHRIRKPHQAVVEVEQPIVRYKRLYRGRLVASHSPAR
jgi:hypothetical protein